MHRSMSLTVTGVPKQLSVVAYSVATLGLCPSVQTARSQPSREVNKMIACIVCGIDDINWCDCVYKIDECCQKMYYEYVQVMLRVKGYEVTA
jgi:hypothetical protein